MPLVPLPVDATSLANTIAELRDEIRRTQPRRLGQSSITSGTLEVAAGGAIRVKNGARLIIEDGGSLLTDSTAVGEANLGRLDEHLAATQDGLSVGADWTPLATLQATAPEWASQAIITTSAHMTAISAGSMTDLKARIKTGETISPDSYAVWNILGATATWTATNITRISPTDDAPVLIKIEALAATPGMLTEHTRARLDTHIIWMA